MKIKTTNKDLLSILDSTFGNNPEVLKSYELVSNIQESIQSLDRAINSTIDKDTVLKLKAIKQALNNSLEEAKKAKEIAYNNNYSHVCL